jgi:two-component system, cell cycle sensor histidine kinase and response regulator CckA
VYRKRSIGMAEKLRILIIEDDPSDVGLMERELERAGIPFESKRVNTRDALLFELLSAPPDLILSDYSLEAFDGMEALKLLKQYHPEIPFIMVTGATNEETAVECIKAGAVDYVIKDHPRRLAQAVSGALLTKKAMEERAAAERALRESELRYRRLFESAQEGILLLDAETGLITDANPFAIDLVQRDRPAVVGRGLAEAGFLPHAAAAHALLEECRKEGCANYEGNVNRPEGRPPLSVEMAFNAALLDQRPVIQCNVRDVTRRKQGEAENQNIQAQLFQAQKMEALGTVVGGVAHDFNNLMTAIQISTDLSLMKVDESHELFRELKEIRNSALRATGLIRQLLLFSRKHPMEFKTLDLNQTIEALTVMLHRLIGEDIDIKTVLDPTIGPVRADPSNVEQVIMNLVLNSRDAMPNGGKVIIRTEGVTLDEAGCKAYTGLKPGVYVRMSVRDTGTGMDQDTLEHIFEPFFTTKASGKGTGLGLSVVYGIVRQHEGAISVESRPGKGTTFLVVLPGGAPESDSTAGASSREPRFTGKGERILLVEDEEKVRESATKAMLKCGYDVTSVGDAKTAMEAILREQGRFDLVFTDVVLSDRTGIDLAEEILATFPALRVLLCSGYTDQKLQWPIIRERGFRFLQKPYDLTALLRAVHDALQ